MSALMQCGQCKADLPDEDPELPGDKVPPCPHCGSKTRIRQVFASDRVSFSALASAKATNAASLVLQAVVEFGDKTDDGRIIQALAPAWFEIIRLLENDPSIAFQIPHQKWEEIIASAYERRGFQVILTPRSGDLGRDVIAEKPGWGCVRFIDQVKAYKPGHLVTAEEVRALGFVLQSDQKANKGVVTTTSDFAPRIVDDPLIKPYMPTRIELINGKDLLQRLSALAKSAGNW